MKKALIVHGGWEGHEPVQTANIVAESLRKEGLEVTLSNSLDSFIDPEYLKTFAVLMPHWTMGAIAGPQTKGLLTAVQAGVGVAGFHGGMGDAFRQACGFQFMVGGQFVGHPGNAGITYSVEIRNHNHPITAGLADFVLTSEQYYMHVDPSNHVLATTTFPAERVPGGEDVVMPVAWTRMHGAGRVFYASVGHVAATVQMAPVLSLITRGALWAAHALE